MKIKCFHILTIGLILITNNGFTQNQFELLYLNGEYKELIDISSKNEDSTTIYWHAIALDKLGETLSAISILEGGIENYSNNVTLEELYANFLYKTGQHAKAKPYLIKHQKNPDIFMKLIRTYELASDNLSAVMLLEERLEYDSLNTEYLERYGDNCNEIGRQLSAREAYKKVVSLNPQNVVVLAKIANLHLKLNEPNMYEMALRYCNLALESDSTNKTIIQIKGIAEFRKGDFDMAEESFGYLFEQGDSSITILKHLGISEYKIYDYEDSYEHLFLAHKKDTADHELCYFMAKDLNFMQAPDSALYYLSLAEALIQPKPAVQVAIIVEQAASYTDLNMNEKAIELYTAAYNMVPRPDYLFFIASLYQNRIKDKAVALDYYTWFLSELPPSTEDNSRHRSTKKSQEISMKRTAEINIDRLKEDLFFSGKLSNDTIVN